MALSSDEVDWKQRYGEGSTPWDVGTPSAEMVRVLEEFRIGPCRVLELGAGTGTNAVELARRGFEVTACELVPQALERARARAQEAGVHVDWLLTDLRALPVPREPYPLVFDRGVYHILRRHDLPGFMEVLRRVLPAGGLWLTLTGNANDPSDDPGPPRLRAVELATEIEPTFCIMQMREFHFAPIQMENRAARPLAWSVLSRRR